MIRCDSKFESFTKIYIYKKRRKKKTKTASKAKTQPSNEYCSVRTRIILIRIHNDSCKS